MSSTSSRSLRERIENLLTLMEKNERDRELSRYYQHGDGSPITRVEWEACRERQGWTRRDFHGEPLESDA